MATTKKTDPVIGQKDVSPAIPKVVAKPVTLAPKVAVPKAAAKKAVAKAVPKVAAKASTKAPAAAKPIAAAVAAPATKSPAKKKATPAAKPVAPEQRANYIQVAAFYIAERRGFAPGNPEQDYLDAAAEIDRLIAGGHFAQ
jgi:hypothetical protein